MSTNPRDKIVSHAAREIKHGMTVNLGIGLPTKVLDHLAPDLAVCLHSENGISGVGPVHPAGQEDRYLIDAGGAYVSTLPGTAFFDSAVSFSLVRRGRLDLTILGAFQVAGNGDLANWTIPGKFTPGPGGAIELAQKARKVVILTTHQDKNGVSKIVRQCSLPLTARRCVDTVYTDMAVLDVTAKGMVLREVASGLSVDQVVAATDAPLIIPQDGVLEF